MTYTVKEVVGLPVRNEQGHFTGETIRKEPGERITKAELAASGQNDNDIEALIGSGAIEDDAS